MNNKLYKITFGIVFIALVTINLVSSFSNKPFELGLNDILGVASVNAETIDPISRKQKSEDCPDPWNPVKKITCEGSGNGCVPKACS